MCVVVVVHYCYELVNLKRLKDQLILEILKYFVVKYISCYVEQLYSLLRNLANYVQHI